MNCRKDKGNAGPGGLFKAVWSSAQAEKDSSSARESVAFPPRIFVTRLQDLSLTIRWHDAQDAPRS